MSRDYLYHKRPTRKRNGQLCRIPCMMEGKLVEEWFSVLGNEIASESRVWEAL